VTHPSAGIEAALAELTEQTLSRGERAGHLALTLFAAAMGAVLIGLLATEVWLPLRTALAIWVLLAIAMAWVAYGLRVLSRRRPLLANREVVAGRMALLFSCVFTAGTMAVGWVNAGNLVVPATWLGATMSAVALANLLRAQWRRARLQALRQQLERQLREG
jgi:hypothetical protein